MQLLKQIVFYSLLLISSISLFGASNDTLKNKTVDSPVLTISYNLTIKTNQRSGVFDIYDGGTRTIFIDNKIARIRQISLMRSQSIFIFPNSKKIVNPYLVVKESGKDKYKFALTPEEWRFYNSKYDSAVFTQAADTANILGFSCQKGVVSLKDGKIIEVWYTQNISNPLIQAIDPLYEKIPGVVLKYSYETKSGSVIFVAQDVSTNAINRSVFQVPGLGFNFIDYRPNEEPLQLGNLLDSTEIEGSDDDKEGK